MSQAVIHVPAIRLLTIIGLALLGPRFMLPPGSNIATARPATCGIGWGLAMLHDGTSPLRMPQPLRSYPATWRLRQPCTRGSGAASRWAPVAAWTLSHNPGVFATR